jgi:HEAT repeat protein
MTRPSLLADPVMGLTRRRTHSIELITRHRHVYFSDLRGVTVGAATLTGRLFYGCMIGPETFAEATLAETCFVCCSGAGQVPADASVAQAIEDGLRGEWDRAWTLLEKPAGLAPEVVEHLIAIAALGLIDPRWEVRQRVMTCIAHLLRENPRLLPADAREVHQAFLLYRTADDSDMVYYDALALVDKLQIPPGVLEHLMGRAHSPDPLERIDALVARRRMVLGVESTEPPFPPLAALLNDRDPDVQLALLKLLHRVAYYWDTEELLPGIDLAEKLDPLLRSGDDRVRREAILYAETGGGPANRDALIAALRDPDPMLRDAAFKALYIVFPQDQLRDFLLHHEATPAQRAMLLERAAYWRAQGSTFNYVADTAELRAMLASDDPRQRRDALLLAGFTGDPALIPDVEAALGDADPRVRAEAERLLPQLRAAQEQAEEGAGG